MTSTRGAALGLVVLGGLNLVVALQGMPGAAVAAVIGLVFVGLGWQVWVGSRQAALAGLVGLGLLIILQLAAAARGVDVLVLVRLAITGGLAYLVYRAYRLA